MGLTTATRASPINTTSPPPCPVHFVPRDKLWQLQLLRCQVPGPTRRPSSHPFCLSDVRCPPNASAQTLDRHGQIFAGVTFGGRKRKLLPAKRSEEENLFLILTKKRQLSCRAEVEEERAERASVLPFPLVILILMALKSRRIFRRISVGLHCETTAHVPGGHS